MTIDGDASHGGGDRPRIMVLMPCFNEEGRIAAVVAAVHGVLPSATVVVVNDCSTDRTAVEASEAGASLLSHGSNLGYGSALETGYFFAMKKGYDIVLQMDGDGQHVAEHLPDLMGPLEDGTADLTIGSRYTGSDRPEATTPLRTAGHRLFSFLIFLLSGLRLTDPTSGFQGLNRRALTLFSSGVFPRDYPDTDVILMASLSGLRIRELPVTMRSRTGGTSMHSGLKPLYYGVKMMLSVFIVLLNVRVWRRWKKEAARHR